MIAKKSGLNARFFILKGIRFYAFFGGFSNIAARTSPAAANTAVG
jgi:hypothetical protein